MMLRNRPVLVQARLLKIIQTDEAESGEIDQSVENSSDDNNQSIGPEPFDGREMSPPNQRTARYSSSRRPNCQQH